MQLVEVLIKLDNVFTAPVYMEKIFPLFWNDEAKIYWLKRGKEAYWKVGIRICTPPRVGTRGQNKESGPTGFT